jgi:hypothetical protein
MAIGGRNPKGIGRQTIEILYFAQALARALCRSSHHNQLATHLVPIADQATAMVDRSIAKGKDTLLQRLSSPLSVLAEFDVPHCSRLERYGRPVTNRRRSVNSTSMQ